MHLIRLHWPVLHIEVPNFDGEVVTCHHIASAVTELHVWDGGDDLREKRSAAWILRLLKDWNRQKHTLTIMTKTKEIFIETPSTQTNFLEMYETKKSRKCRGTFTNYLKCLLFKKKKKKINFLTCRIITRLNITSLQYLHFECLSQSAAARMSHRRMVPLLLLYTNTLHWCGWHSAAVITSVNSSMLAGLMSTISGNTLLRNQQSSFS